MRSGTFSLDLGHATAAALTLPPLDYIPAIFTPWVALGISLLIVWLLSRMALLSWADLSYVLPVTSLGYVASALLGALLPERADHAAALGGHAADRRGNGAGRASGSPHSRESAL